MNPIHKFSTYCIATFALFTFGAMVPKIVLAEYQADRAEYKREVDTKIQDLRNKIDEVKDKYREAGQDIHQKIQVYSDEIDQIKRDADAKLKEMAQVHDQGLDTDRQATWDKDRTDINDRVSNITKDFHEWRLNHAIESYQKKIEDVKLKASAESNATKKIELDEKVKKLEANYAAAQSKLTDLKTTQGANWDVIQADLDRVLEDIDHQYDVIQSNT